MRRQRWPWLGLKGVREYEAVASGQELVAPRDGVGLEGPRMGEVGDAMMELAVVLVMVVAATAATKASGWMQAKAWRGWRQWLLCRE